MPCGFSSARQYAQRHDRTLGYFKLLVPNYFISLMNLLQHPGCVCSPGTQHGLCLQSRIRDLSVLCRHSCIRSALDRMKLEQKSLPCQDTLQGDRAPQKETRGSISARRTSKKYLHFVTLQSPGRIPEGVAKLIQVIVFR